MSFLKTSRGSKLKIAGVCALSALAFVLSLSGDLTAEVSEVSLGGDEGSYVIGPENLVHIKILGEAGTNSVYRVNEMGFISHGLVGQIKLGGLTVLQAENYLVSKLAGDYIINPQVTVFILEHSHFSILGEVRRPGTYEILGRVSVIEAISMAGGFTPVANQGDIKIQRKHTNDEQETLTIDATKITQRGDRSSDITMEADDVMVVSKSFF